MDVDQKVEIFQRVIAAWNRDDIDAVLAYCADNWEWDLSDSDLPGESRVHRGGEFRGFAQRFKETIGAAPAKIEGYAELEDGRLYVKIHMSGTGAQSGVEVALTYVQILSFEAEKVRRIEAFTDPAKARAAAGVVPELQQSGSRPRETQ
jgi:ketosteroid isomerase-like protein